MIPTHNCSSFENKSHKKDVRDGYSTCRVCRTHHVAMQTSSLSILLPLHPIPMLYMVPQHLKFITANQEFTEKK